jgi:hypothetical protein
MPPNMPARRRTILSTVGASGVCLVSLFALASSTCQLDGGKDLGLNSWNTAARPAFVVPGGFRLQLAKASHPSTCSSSLVEAPQSLSAPRSKGFLVGLVAQYRGRGGGGGRGRGRFVVAPVQKGPPMNNEIPFSEMRVVVANADGKDTMLGVLSKEEALREADERVSSIPLATQYTCCTITTWLLATSPLELYIYFPGAFTSACFAEWLQLLTLIGIPQGVDLVLISPDAIPPVSRAPSQPQNSGRRDFDV